MALKPGDPAPEFRGKTTDGSELNLSDFRGKKLVLYFYPMDFTPGCTAQACSLRDGYDEIRERGAEVVGVSTQGAESHRRFSQFYRLPFPLIADVDQTIARAYGVIGGGPFSFMRTLIGVADRVTFLIDEHGTIAQVIDRPVASKHADEVLTLL